jgi:hypothetical protein
MAQHHHRVARGAKEVVGELDHPPVPTVIEAELGEPVLEVAEHLPPPGLHAVQHLEDAGLDAACAVDEGRALGSPSWT